METFKIGLGLPQLGELANRDAVHTVARTAEEQGYSSLWCLDRVLAPVAPRNPYPARADGALPVEQRIALDPVVTLAAASAVTDHIRLGTSVLVAPLYSPVLLARTAATLDVLSGGRFTLGLGLGWSADEFEAVGVPQRQLALRLEEMLEVMARAWRDDVVEVETSRERVAASTIGLKPSGGAVPVLLAAFTPAGLERIARRADGWMPTGFPTEVMAAMWQGVLQTAERYGRDPSSLQLVVRGNVKLTDGDLGDDRPPFEGSLAQICSDIARTREAGAHELILDLHGNTRSVQQFLDLAGLLTTLVAA